jgi:hypothetical protein
MERGARRGRWVYLEKGVWMLKFVQLTEKFELGAIKGGWEMDDHDECFSDFLRYDGGTREHRISLEKWESSAGL